MTMTLKSAAELVEETTKIQARSMRVDEIRSVVARGIGEIQKPWSPGRYRVLRLYGDVDPPNYGEIYGFVQEVYRQLDELGETGAIDTTTEDFHIVAVTKPGRFHLKITRHRVVSWS